MSFDVLIISVSPTWTEIPQNTIVSLNSTARFDCQASGFPKPRISWKAQNRKGRATSYYFKFLIQLFDYVICKVRHYKFFVADIWTVESATTKYQVFSNGSLVINKVTAEDGGMYTCIANNTIGQIIRTSAKFVVGSMFCASSY